MTNHQSSHLNSDECAAAADLSLDRARAAHTEECAECHAEVEAVRALLGSVARADVPEPSPLFWDHFSARVREATTGAAAPASSWWERLVRPAALVTSVAAVAVLAVWMTTRPTEAPTGADPASLARAGAAREGVSGGDWEPISELASALPAESLSVESIDALDTGGADDAAALDDLSGDELTVLAQLLREELAVLQ